MTRPVLLLALLAFSSITTLVAQPRDAQLERLRARAEAGDPDAQVVLGGLYEVGDGVERDGARAIAWYRKAAERGHAEAQLNLGTLYLDGAGVRRDPAAAVRVLRQ